jgi:hypothetical protein
VTNELFPNEREGDAHCQYNPLPEDTTNLTPISNSGSPASDYSSDSVNFAAFMRLSAPPAPVMDITTELNSRGGQVFNSAAARATPSSKLPVNQATPAKAR